jgi:hypothetical protein
MRSSGSIHQSQPHHPPGRLEPKTDAVVRQQTVPDELQLLELDTNVRTVPKDSGINTTQLNLQTVKLELPQVQGKYGIVPDIQHTSLSTKTTCHNHRPGIQATAVVPYSHPNPVSRAQGLVT